MEQLTINQNNFSLLYGDISSYQHIFIEPGEYVLNKTITLSNCDNIIIESSDSDKKPVFNFIEQEYGENGIVVVGNNITIKNIIIKNAGYKGLFVQTNNSFFENIETCWCCNSGFQLKFGGNNIVLNCTSHHNIDYKTTYKNGDKKYGANADGFSDKQHSSTPNIFIGCKSYNNSDDGFDFFQRITPKNEYTLLAYCEAYNNGFSYFDLTDCERRKTIDKSFFEKFTPEEIKQFKTWQPGNGFKLGGKCTSHNIHCIKCNAHDNQKAQITRNSNTGDIILEDCVNNGYIY